MTRNSYRHGAITRWTKREALEIEGMAKRVRAWRKRLGLLQHEVDTAAGLPIRTTERVERPHVDHRSMPPSSPAIGRVTAALQKIEDAGGSSSPYVRKCRSMRARQRNPKRDLDRPVRTVSVLRQGYCVDHSVWITHQACKLRIEAARRLRPDERAGNACDGCPGIGRRKGVDRRSVDVRKLSPPGGRHGEP